MGIPGFSRWLQEKYPNIIKPCSAETQSTSKINFDNLYLDMNDIIHLSTGSKKQTIPKNEDEIIESIFHCIDRIFSIIRPRKLLYMAVDGVAPRAKMHHQRSTRFLDAQKNPSETGHFNKYLKVLREELKNDLKINLSAPLVWDSERTIDDWVFICFLGGNDFFPNLLSIQFYENVMNILTDIYKNLVIESYDYLTKDAKPNMKFLKIFLTRFGAMENELFKSRHENNQKQRKKNQAENSQTSVEPDDPSIDINKIQESLEKASILQSASPCANEPSASTSQKLIKDNIQSLEMQVNSSSVTILTDSPPRDQRFGETEEEEASDSSESNREELVDSEEEEDDPNDNVRLWEEGGHERYYKEKFNIDSNDLEKFRIRLVEDYVRGLCWILQYYYKGIPSWNWYYPYYYVPFASDFSNLENVAIDFNKKSEPLLPLEQLLATFPPQYANYLPQPWQYLILNKEKSSIIDFYPIDFYVDRNGKRHKWQGVVLLPFVDEERLLQVLKPVYSTLILEEKKRNRRDYDRLFIHSTNSCYIQLKRLYNNNNRESQITPRNSVPLSIQFSGGMTGQVWPDDKDKFKLIDSTIQAPKPNYGQTIKQNQVLSVKYRNL